MQNFILQITLCLSWTFKPLIRINLRNKTTSRSARGMGAVSAQLCRMASIPGKAYSIYPNIPRTCTFTQNHNFPRSHKTRRLQTCLQNQVCCRIYLQVLLGEVWVCGVRLVGLTHGHHIRCAHVPHLQPVLVNVSHNSLILSVTRLYFFVVVFDVFSRAKIGLLFFSVCSSIAGQYWVDLRSKFWAKIHGVSQRRTKNIIEARDTLGRLCSSDLSSVTKKANSATTRRAWASRAAEANLMLKFSNAFHRLILIKNIF